MARYPQVYDNEWVQPIKSGYRMSCCDCDLVHELDFRIHKGKVQFRARRNNRATAAKRRTKKNRAHQPEQRISNPAGTHER